MRGVHAGVPGAGRAVAEASHGRQGRQLWQPGARCVTLALAQTSMPNLPAAAAAARGRPPPSRPSSQNTHTHTHIVPTHQPTTHYNTTTYHPATTPSRSCVRPDESSMTTRCHYLVDGSAVFAITIRRAGACGGTGRQPAESRHVRARPFGARLRPSPPALSAHRRVCAASLLPHRAVPTAAPCPPCAAAEYFIPAGILLKCFLEVTDRELYDKLVLSVAAVSTPTPPTAASLLPNLPCSAVAVRLRRCGEAQGYRAAATASSHRPAPPCPPRRSPQNEAHCSFVAERAELLLRQAAQFGLGTRWAGRAGGGLGCIGVNLGRECLPEGWDFVAICEPGGRGVGGSGGVHGSRAAVSRAPAVERCATRLARGPPAGPSAWSTWATCSVPRWTRPHARRTTRHAGPPAPALPLLRWPCNSWPLPRLSGCCCCRFGHPSCPLALPPDRRAPVVLPAGGGAAAAGPCVHPPGLPSGQAAADGADASQAVCAGERGAGPPAGASRLAQRSVGRSTA